MSTDLERISNWRLDIRSYKDVTEEHKAEFLRLVKEHGNWSRAADSLGISFTSLRTCMKRDEEFGIAAVAMKEIWKEKGISIIENSAITGSQRTTYNKEGDIIKEETVYETALRTQFLKAHDPKTYTPTQVIDIQSGGKPLAVVPTTSDPDDWEKMAAKLNEDVDGS